MTTRPYVSLFETDPERIAPALTAEQVQYLRTGKGGRPPGAFNGTVRLDGTLTERGWAVLAVLDRGAR